MDQHDHHSYRLIGCARYNVSFHGWRAAKSFYRYGDTLLVGWLGVFARCRYYLISGAGMLPTQPRVLKPGRFVCVGP